MALSHKLKDDAKIIYPFGSSCAGYANSILTQKRVSIKGDESYVTISEELTQGVIDLMKSRDEQAFKELFEAVKGKKETA